MTRVPPYAVIVGLAVTLVGAIAAALGAFDGFERRSIDYRYRHAPRRRAPMTDQIVHVDIDDGALDDPGAWPWPRAWLAGVVVELRRAGARTIALDIDFRSPSRFGEEDDAALATALAGDDVVLAVVLGEGRTFGDDWSGEPGADELDALLDVLARDLALGEEEVIAAAGLTGVRRDRFKNRHTRFRRVAAWNALVEQGAPETFEAFEARLMPQRTEFSGDYPERPILESAWQQHAAWDALRPFLMDAPLPGREDDQPPIPVLAGQAAGAGFVNIALLEHADGVVREIPVRRPAHRGSVLQFGLAAVAHYLGAPAAEVAGDRHEVAGRPLPVRRGERLWIHWPTSETSPRWEGLLRQRESDDATTGHFTIREFVKLAEARQRIQASHAQRRALAALILGYAGTGYDASEPLPDALATAVHDEVDFTLADVDASDEDPAYRDHLHNCRLWQALDRAIVQDEFRIASVEARVREIVEDKLVFVGWTATGAIADFVATPIDPKTPGVVVHAALADMLITGRRARFPPAGTTLVLALLAGLLATAIGWRLSTAWSVMGAIALAVVYAAAVALAFASDLILPFVAPVATGAIAWTAVTAMQAAVAQSERRRITRQFKARVSSQLVDYLVENPESVVMSGAEREVTVLFGDLAGFTKISESLGGATTVTTLNRYMKALADALVEHGAYLNKFLGDGVMAFWSAFTPDVGQAVHACRAAVACQDMVAKLNAAPAAPGVPALGLRIGVATGPVVVGDCGAPPALNDYTVIGDAVNLASRLESASKQFGTSNLVDARTREQLGPNDVAVRPIGLVVVVGQTRPVDVFEVLPCDGHDELIALSAGVVEAFARRDRDACAGALEAFAARFGETPFVETYREALAKADLDGVLRLTEK